METEALMRINETFAKVGLIASSILLPFACGTNNPTGPSGMATIEGTVNPGSVASVSSARVFSAGSTSASVTVSVVGTSLSTTTDSAGHFVLSGVAQGNAMLRFQGPGIDATVEISGLVAGQTLTITVHVSGSTAVVDVPSPSPSPSPQQQCAAVGANAEIEGDITAATASSITVFQQGDVKGSYLCQVSSATKISKGNTNYTLSQLQLGWRVHVSGTGLGSSAGVCQIKADQIVVQ
jgi:hypothetical protein